MVKLNELDQASMAGRPGRPTGGSPLQHDGQLYVHSTLDDSEEEFIEEDVGQAEMGGRPQGVGGVRLLCHHGASEPLGI